MIYYTVCVFGTNTEGKRVAGCHIIKATSKENALDIRKRHGISNPRFAIGNLHITCKEINLSAFKEVNLEMLKRRRKGIGGFIWYEDEKGNLQHE